ncbi:MAG: hypothetical protein CMG74_03770 [Candidatus Marinimicrobia bacterium]|nr:hypothetical protein [Candidatus Neomarinimicrobiota bacterium]
MFLMIWVNDFWTLTNIPKWLIHAKYGEDYLGFSDLIFPWFLFIVGLSIPYAIENRISQGQKSIIIWIHILFRTIALIIMGLFHMNMETYNHDVSIISKPIFTIICTIAIFSIWNKYPKNKNDNKSIFRYRSIIGIFILACLFIIYKGKGNDGSEIGFSIHWWGILGLIGWVYIIAASLYLIFRKSTLAAVILFTACIILNIVSSLGYSYNIFSWQNSNWIPGNGGLQGLAFGGIITSLLLKKYDISKNIRKFYTLLSIIAIIAFFSGLFLRKYFIINKISGTPSWILISLSSSILIFTLLHWITDLKGKINWYKPINTAGTDTLTCYLVPYIYYSAGTILGIQMPVFLRTGIIGLTKSILFSFIIIWIARLLRTKNIRLII